MSKIRPVRCVTHVRDAGRGGVALQAQSAQWRSSESEVHHKRMLGLDVGCAIE